MAIADLINLIATNGIAVVIIAYFLYKDYKFNGQILNVLGETKEILAVLKTYHAKEDETDGN